METQVGQALALLALVVFGLALTYDLTVAFVMLWVVVRDELRREADRWS